MLLVVFHIGPERYGLDCREVREIIPLVNCRELPLAPDYVRGLFRFRGRPVPVIDLCHLSGEAACRTILSTRIMLVDFPTRDGQDRLLGLMAERVVEMVEIEDRKVRPSGLKLKGAPFLGDVVTDDRGDGQGLIQLIRAADLLPEEVQELLFADLEGEAADD